MYIYIYIYICIYMTRTASFAGLRVPPPEHVADHGHEEVHPSWFGEEADLGLGGFRVHRASEGFRA